MKARSHQRIVLSIVLSAAARVAHADPTISLHLTPASYSGCGTIDVDELTCEDLDVEGANSSPQFAFVLATGVEAIQGLQFGITFPTSVDVLTWTLCTGGMSIPEDEWPGSGTALALTWPDAFEPDNPDQLALVGFFTIASGSTGTLSITDDARIEGVEYVDSSGTHTIPGTLLATADVCSGGFGYNPCNQSAGSSESQSFGSGESLVDYLRSDDTTSALRHQLFMASDVIGGEVIEVDEVELPSLPDETRRRARADFGFAEIGRSYDDIEADVYRRYAVAVETALPHRSPGGIVPLLQLVGCRFRDGSLGREMEARELQVGEHCLAFCTLIRLTDGTDALLLKSARRYRSEDASSLQAVWAAIQRHRSAADNVADSFRDGASYVRGVLREFVPVRPHTAVRRMVLEVIAPARLRPSVTLELPLFANRATPSVAIAGPLQGPFQVGDTLWVSVRQEEGSLVRPRLGGVGIFRESRGTLFHGRRAVRSIP